MKRYSISFVFPMYNEAPNIELAIQRATRLAGSICDDYEIVVVDDASTDGSAGIVEGLSRNDAHLRLLRLRTNTKFGGALKDGLKNASKDIVLYTDADFPASERDIRRALELLDGADIVSAYSLVMKDSSFRRIIMSHVYNFMIQLLFGLNLRDINSGLKIYKRRVFDGMELGSNSPFIDVEIFAEAAKRNFRILQHGLIFELRTKGHSSISRPGIVLRTFRDMIAYKICRPWT